ncbi:uncharacterized protein LOC106141856 [Amyelois transitella]|uniref:uncharacterized protein LOC106141856 n=1 Tax=Amyelois transitella TaxID=680683 RepID=UPI00067B242D|nr:uncharacterized protein LOC106141856 [Amyelois transitella]
MPRTGRSRIQLSDEEKKKRRREQKKLSIRRARAKMDEAALEERRRQDRERYYRKKEQGKIKTIKDYTPREQRNIRKIWREKAKLKRQKIKNAKNALNFIEQNTPPSSPSFSRMNVGNATLKRNARKLRNENRSLKQRILFLESKMAKYRMRALRSSKRNENRNKNSGKKLKKVKETKKAVEEFLLQDGNSTLTSGKKDTITRKKIKKQIRFLNDSLINLHKSFVNKLGINISYETFRRYRPFWVLFPKVNSRNTCLCVIHANNDFMIQSLHTAKIIPYKSITEVLKHLCCNNSLNLACLDNRCSGCKDKFLECDISNANDTLSYERWITKSFPVVIKNVTKQCRKTIKERVQTTKKGLFEKFISNLPILKKHVGTMIYQIKAIQCVQKNMSPVDGLLHIDFSENYNCKYGQEVQSAHFGGSKAQISLHTSVYYNTNLEPPNNYINSTSFCTASENLRHDPVAISIHLMSLIERIKELSPNLQTLHILSDGPLTQYRNKSMFFLVASLLSKEFSVSSIIWHFSERGHGKGAPDGVGGCIKRICDSHVARGKDVSNLDDLMACLSVNCKGIEVFKIDESKFSEIDLLLKRSATRPFKGTLQIHQITWHSENPNVIHARRLSCLECAAYEKCSHYEIGQIEIDFKVTNSPIESIISGHTFDNEPASPQAGPSNQPNSLFEQNLPESPRTSSASTKPISPGFSDKLTPDNPIEDVLLQNYRPNKGVRRTRLILNDSDSSDEAVPKKRRMPCWFDDSEDENIF